MSEKLDEKKLFKVRLLNDDYTPMEFVVSVLTGIFNKSNEEAVKVMLETHRTGKATIVVLGQAEAEAIVERVHEMARQNKHPLMCVIEPE